MASAEVMTALAGMSIPIAASFRSYASGVDIELLVASITGRSRRVSASSSSLTPGSTSLPR